MKPLPACLPCILHQVLQVARESSDDEWSQRKVLNEVLRELPQADWNLSPAEILSDAIEQARHTLNVSDPYAGPRTKVHKSFKPIADEFRERLKAAEDPFALATTAVAAANLVDELIFERFSRQDSKAVFEETLEAGFAFGSPDQLREALLPAKSVLYMLDNAGEVYFDAMLIDLIEKMGKVVRVVVRGGGLLHDLTTEEAITAGLARFAGGESEEALVPVGEEDDPEPPPDLVIMGHGQLGVPHVAGDLAVALEASDLVIAKGSANYQTFSSGKREVVYLLRAKCTPIAHELGVSVGGLVLLRETPTQDEEGSA